MNPVFSIITPAYNSELYIETCINSLLRQTFSNFELIIINDGSTDNTTKICDDFAVKDERIRVIHKKNEGVSTARNLGITMSKGQYITFIDSDDWVDSNMLYEINEIIANTKADIIVSGLNFNYVTGDFSVPHKIDTPNYCENKEQIGQHIILLEKKLMFGYACNKFYKNEVIKLKNLRYPKEVTYMEDLLFNCDYLMHIKTMYVTNKYYYHYMIRDGVSLSSKFTPEIVSTVRLVREKMNDLFEYYDIKSSKYPTNLPDSYIRGIQSCIYNMYHKDSNWHWKKRKKFISEIINDKNLQVEIENFEATDLYSRLFLSLYKTGNTIIINISYTLLFKVRNNLRPLYLKIRKKLLS